MSASSRLISIKNDAVAGAVGGREGPRFPWGLLDVDNPWKPLPHSGIWSYGVSSAMVGGRDAFLPSFLRRRLRRIWWGCDRKRAPLQAPCWASACWGHTSSRSSASTAGMELCGYFRQKQTVPRWRHVHLKTLRFTRAAGGVYSARK